MAQETKLSIAVKTDLKDGRSLLKFLNDLSALGNKTAKALQGINLGSAGPGAQKGGLAKALLEQKSLFNDLGQAGEKLSRVLTNVVGRSTEELDRKLERVNKRLQKAVEISEKFRALADKGGGGRGSAATGRANAADDLVQSLSVQYENLSSARSALGSSASSLNLRSLLAQVPGFGWLGMLGGTVGGIYGAYRLGGMAKNTWAGYQEGMLDLAGRPSWTAAEQGRASGQYIVGSMTGNLSQAYFTAQADRDPHMREYIDRKADIAARENGFFNNEINPLKWWSRIQNRDAAVSAAKTTANYEFLQLKADADPLNKFGLDYLQQNAGSWVAGSRRTGMGARDFATNPWASSGLSAEERQSVLLGLVGTAGRGGLGLEGSVLASVRAGMQPGVAASIAGAGAVGGDLLASLRATGLDPTAVQEALGQGAAGLLGPQNLIGSLPGLVASLASGVGGTSAEQLRAIQQNLSGMQGGQALFSGSNPWQKSVNLSNAVAELPGGSIYAQNKLANLDFPTLISLLNDKSGSLPGQWTGLGITRGSMEGFATRTFSSTLSRFIDQGGGDEASKLARHIQSKYNGNIRAWARSSEYSNEGAEVLAGLLSETDQGTYGNDTQALGSIRVMAGRGAYGGGGSGAGQNDVAFEALSVQLGKLNDVVTKLLTPMSDLNTAASTAAKNLRTPAPGLPWNSNPMVTPFTGIGR